MGRVKLVEALALAAAVALIFVSLTCEVRANGSRDALALGIAKVSANEGAIWSPEETGLVCQVVMGSGPTDGARLRWLQRHSGRVMGLRECKSGNCLWSRNLMRNAKTMPANIASGTSIKNWKAYWRVELSPRWERVMRDAEACVRGELAPVCHLPPKTWDGRRWSHKAMMNGWVAIGCEGTSNEGYRRMWFKW